MSGPNIVNAQITAALGLALNALNSGQQGAAEVHLARILSARPLEPDALQLLGLVRAMQGRFAEAETLYRKSLSVRPNQAHVRHNLGNALAALNRLDEAIAAYREAIRLKPDYADAHVGMASTLLAQKDLEAAERHYRLALRHQPRSVGARVGLGALLCDAGRAEEAEQVLRQVLTKPPANPRELAQVEFNLAVALKLQARYVEALALLDHAKAIAPNLVDVDYHRGGTLQRLGKVDGAIESYRCAIATNPLNLAAHHELNGLLYRERRDDEFLRSFDEAAKRAPKAAILPFNKSLLLTRSGRFAEARTEVERALALDPGNQAVLNGLAVTLTGLGEYEKAIAVYDDTLKRAPDDVLVRTNFAGTLLQAGEAKRAVEMALGAIERAPIDQNALSMLDLALRASGDSRAEDLANYESFVAVFDLEPPEGFADMDSFNRALDRFLDSVHTDSREHVDQTLRGGTQTFERLFFAGHDLVEALRVRIEEAIARYTAQMREAPEHPLLGRRQKTFGFAGSWSSRLHDCGFHTNHIHPKGWISSCYYVAVPDVAADAQGRQGWLKLGEPNFDAHLQDPIRRVVQPKPGRLVLFPSYMWHGTVPFHSSQDRTTIAFDAVPKE
jgi:tetratricopeptide (TPR) repeat protein